MKLHSYKFFSTSADPSSITSMEWPKQVGSHSFLVLVYLASGHIRSIGWGSIRARHGDGEIVQKAVQHLEGGIVSDILAQNGLTKIGQPLLILTPLSRAPHWK